MTTPTRTRTGPLTECLTALSGTPDDSSWIGSQLAALAGLVADHVPAVTWASITTWRAGSLVTVAQSDPAVRPLDDAQCTAQAGPSLDALDTGAPVAVPDLVPGPDRPPLHAAASTIGARAGLCIPLFAGRGTTTAVLNLYGRDRTALHTLTAAVASIHDRRTGAGRHAVPQLGSGTADLIDGFVAALDVRVRIQQGIAALAGTAGRSTDTAYLILRLRAAETGRSLLQTAADILEEYREG